MADRICVDTELLWQFLNSMERRKYEIHERAEAYHKELQKWLRFAENFPEEKALSTHQENLEYFWRKLKQQESECSRIMQSALLVGEKYFLAVSEMQGDTIREGQREAAGMRAEKGAVWRTGAGKETMWRKTVSFQGRTVMQRDDLLGQPGSERYQRNLCLMQQGKAPVGPDGKPVNLHHMIQSDTGRIAEVSSTFHKKYHGILHINPSTIPSGINRQRFDCWKKRYWKERARQLVKKRK